MSNRSRTEVAGVTMIRLHERQPLLIQTLSPSVSSFQQNMSYTEIPNAFQQESRHKIVRRAFGSRLETMVNPQPGTYALVLSSSVPALIRVGRLGGLQLQLGSYVYIGSAHGPGGLRARLAHHLEPTGRPHWHVDYLRAHTNPEEVWYCCGRISREHRWAYCLSLQRGASVPLARFGASDCTCESHLLFFGSRPSRAAFARRLGILDRSHPPVGLYRPNP